MTAWAPFYTSRRTSTPGFTIVELLIVIVVIAILAAITIVAYNGIQNRAKSSAVNTAASQAGKKILSYAPTNTDRYPTEANFADTTFRTSTLSLPGDTTTASYDYYASDDQKSFCLSVTNTTTDPITAYAMTQSGQVVQGRCVKNLVINPSFEANTNGWSLANGATTTGIAASARLVGTNGVPLSTANTSDSGIGRSFTYEAGKTYTFSCMIQSKATASYTYKTSAQGSGVPAAGTVTRVLTADQQVRLAATFTMSSTPATGMYYCLRSGGQSGTAAFNVDGVMLTETSQLYSYGDGNTQNWSWTAGEHTSTSFGPALPEN
jgi:prepilin-type N-terminal cleavage/methylation domain-containing protein